MSDLKSQLPSGLPPEPDPTHFTLGGYTGPSRVIEGVSFWPRVGARMIDIVVMTFLAFIAGLLFGAVLAFMTWTRRNRAAAPDDAMLGNIEQERLANILREGHGS